MTQQASSTVSRKRRPIISEVEIAILSRRYGAPARRSVQIQADRYLRRHRWRADSDRRAEVVFAIEDPRGRIWVHAKRHYPSHVYRLPSGGVNWDETVEHALFREIDEETALPVKVARFVGVIDYRFRDQDSVAYFASYIFHLRCGSGQPHPHADENISEFRAVLPCQLPQIAADLRNMVGDRRGWGQFRAIPHDLVYERLSG